MASRAISGRTTAWDKRQAILFLRLPPDSMPPEDDTRWWLSLLPPQDPYQQDFLFAGMGENPGDYALSTSNPVWLPAKEESVESDVFGGSELFLIGPVKEDGSHPEVSLSTLRVAVTASLADWAEDEFIGSLSGVVTYDGPQAIPEEAVLLGEMLESPSFGRDGLTRVEHHLEKGERFPFEFSIRYNSALRTRFEPEPPYFVKVEIRGQSGEILYLNDPAASVATGKHIEDFQVAVVPAPVITGTIIRDYGGESVPAGAVLSIDVYEQLQSGGYYRHSTSSRPLGVGERFPIPLVIPYDPQDIRRDRAYIPHVEIIGPSGRVLYSNRTYPPAITNGEVAEDVRIVIGPSETINGSVTYDGPEEIPDGSVLSVHMRVVAESYTRDYYVPDISYPLGDDARFPVPFAVSYNPRVTSQRGIDPETAVYYIFVEIHGPNGEILYRHDYENDAFPLPLPDKAPKETVEAPVYFISAVNGMLTFAGDSYCRPRYAGESSHPVITGGNPSDGVQVELSAVDAPYSDEIDFVTGTVITDSVAEGILVNYLRFGNGDLYPGYIELREASRGCTIGRQEIDSRDGFPLPFSFSIPYDPAAIDPDGTYALEVNIPLWTIPCPDLCGSGARYRNDERLVLTGGHPGKDVEVKVRVVRWMS